MRFALSPPWIGQLGPAPRQSPCELKSPLHTIFVGQWPCSPHARAHTMRATPPRLTGAHHPANPRAPCYVTTPFLSSRSSPPI
uniref:Uncharacterized protein n=1 Tax=Setaria viridis TaxID=4556 RepID=A0A4V6D9Y8_SETVI|nr:hypothetical protein SEVIR_3G271971v2 [Setaria viridis]